MTGIGLFIEGGSSRGVLCGAFAVSGALRRTAEDIERSGVIWDFGGIRGTLLSQSGTDVASMLARVTKVVDKTIKMFNRQLEETD